MRTIACGGLFLFGCSAQPSAAIDASTPDVAADTTTMTADASDASVDSNLPCTDPCPAPNGGITLGCEKRFVYGVNYAWKNFGADFGGIQAWNLASVSSAPQGYAQDLAAMAMNGASVIRWWILPDLRSSGVTFDNMNVPTGVTPTMLADIAKALELADEAGVFLMPTLLSFDAFHTTQTVSNVLIRSIQPIASSASSRQAFVEKVVRPIVKAAEQSPYKTRIHSWDVINEPEWAISGASLYGGDQAFTPSNGLATLTHAQMETFIKDIEQGIRAETKAMVSVGGAAPKWAHAWSMVNLEFYQWHYYDWVHQYWPYTDGPAKYKVDKPVVVGELPLGMLGGDAFPDVAAAFYQNGYAGALGWAFTDMGFGPISNVKPFASQHMCETHYDLSQKSIAWPARAPVSMKSMRFCRWGSDRPECESR